MVHLPESNWATQVDLPQPSWEGMGLGVGILAAAVLLALVVRAGFAAYLRWRGHGRSAVDVFSKLAGWVVVVLGLGVALAIVFPSVQPVDVLGGLGIVSIAAGIAFQTVLGNMFAGIMILAGGRYVVGDQIGVGDVQGEVTDISLNVTMVRTFDGRQVLIPNQVMHSDVVVVQTGYEQVRTTVTVQIDAVADPARAQRIAVEAMSALPLVQRDPAPQALLTILDKGALTLELRFWSGARQLETREAQHAVIAKVLAAFTEAGVRLADEVQTIDAAPDLLRTLGMLPDSPVSGDDEGTRPSRRRVRP
ncbi:MAG: mechanosensitive ion channel family protein [Ornithinimicrobium sp.]|uniref:mechanosensitive ion channel family protein n=1 Tax=Ornithinimicrobium sp. TaxID=1977084 RepID=UPI003D9B6EA4